MITGHADLISKEQIQELKEDNPNTKFAQYFRSNKRSRL